MKKFLIFYLLCSGCEYQLDDVINKNVNLSAEFSENNISIEFLIDGNNIPFVSPQRHLYIAKELKKRIGNSKAFEQITIFYPSLESIKSIEIFSMNAWGMHTRSTNLSEYILIINPELHYVDCYEFVDTFTHEITHAHLYYLDGDSDSFHTNRKIWALQEITAKLIYKDVCF